MDDTGDGAFRKHAGPLYRKQSREEVMLLLKLRKSKHCTQKKAVTGMTWRKREHDLQSHDANMEKHTDGDPHEARRTSLQKGRRVRAPSPIPWQRPRPELINWDTEV